MKYSILCACAIIDVYTIGTLQLQDMAMNTNPKIVRFVIGLLEQRVSL